MYFFNNITLDFVVFSQFLGVICVFPAVFLKLLLTRLFKFKLKLLNEYHYECFWVFSRFILFLFAMFPLLRFDPVFFSCIIIICV